MISYKSITLKQFLEKLEVKLGCLKKGGSYLIAGFDDSSRKKDIIFQE